MSTDTSERGLELLIAHALIPSTVRRRRATPFATPRFQHEKARSIQVVRQRGVGCTGSPGG